jgi:hypothetical protein
MNMPTACKPPRREAGSEGLRSGLYSVPVSAVLHTNRIYRNSSQHALAGLGGSVH